MASAQLPPRKGAYAKHITALHKDQHFRVQAKNAQEIELLEDFHGYMKKRAAIEKQYSEALLKLTNTYQAHKIIPIPDIGNPASAQSRADDDSGLGSSLANPRTYNGNQPKVIDVMFNLWVSAFFMPCVVFELRPTLPCIEHGLGSHCARRAILRNGILYGGDKICRS